MKKTPEEIFAASEIAALEADGSDTAKVVLMLIYTGMRVGELFRLTLADYHETYVIAGEKTAAGRKRVIPIRPEAHGCFAYFVSIATGERLLSGYGGNLDKRNFRNLDYYPLLKNLGITRKSPHATRRTYISAARRMGMRPEILEQILGYASCPTMMDTDALIAAVEACFGSPDRLQSQ